MDAALLTPAVAKEAPTLPFWYWLKHFYRLRRNYVDAFMRLYRDYGDVVRIQSPRVVHFFFHPDHVKHLLKDNQKNYKKSIFFAEMKPLLGNGLLTSEGELWKRQRRLIAPEFQLNHIQKFSKLITDATQSTISLWEQAAKSHTPRDIVPDMMQLTFRIAGESLFGSEVESHAPAVAEALNIASDDAVRRMVSLIKIPRSWPTSRNRQAKAALETLNHVVSHIVEKRFSKSSHSQDLLSRLLSLRDEETGAIPMDLLKSEVMTLLLAGHETTSNALSWTWYLLSQNPEAAATLQEELTRVLAGRTPTTEDLAHLPYTKRVFLESMRLYPPAPVISRNAISDDSIGGFPIPAGTIVECAPWVTHRHPAFWREPEKFQPDRFLNQDLHPFQYFPFGGGARECIGKNFALMEGQLILATIAQRFRVQLVPNHPVDTLPLITLKPRYGLKMEIEAVP